MVMTTKRWRIERPDEMLVKTFQKELGIPAISAKILAARGFDTIESARAF